jgi:hypothetical protein
MVTIVDASGHLKNKVYSEAVPGRLLAIEIEAKVDSITSGHKLKLQ